MKMIPMLLFLVSFLLVNPAFAEVFCPQVITCQGYSAKDCTWDSDSYFNRISNFSYIAPPGQYRFVAAYSSSKKLAPPSRFCEYKCTNGHCSGASISLNTFKQRPFARSEGAWKPLDPPQDNSWQCSSSEAKECPFVTAPVGTAERSVSAKNWE